MSNSGEIERERSNSGSSGKRGTEQEQEEGREKRRKVSGTLISFRVM